MAFAMLFLAAIGCEQKTNVSGVVTFQGKIVPYGTVYLEDAQGVPHNGVILKDGTYAIQDALMPGEIRVAVSTRDPKKIRRLRREGDKEGFDKPLPPALDIPNWFPLPEKYSSIETSESKYPIKNGRNVINIELQ